MLFERPEVGHRAVVLQVELRDQPNPDRDEFVELARSAEIDVRKVVLARRDTPSPRFFVGTGKVDELKGTLRGSRAKLVLINHELSAGQQRNLEQALDCRVMTRTELILAIFADRARSHEGQLQVELAQLTHAQTRLVRGWTHLDRQKGGVNLRGAGEKQIELDQRMLSERIKAMEKKLATVAKRRGQSRRGRHRKGAPTVALAGYTNAGKSTLFNALTRADVYAEDQLFATLDPTMRRLAVPGLREAVLADTVGFVSLLPHALVEAFKATLEEVVYADLLLHVVDVADALCALRISQVREVLAEIGATNVPELLVFNKADLVPGGLPAARELARHVVQEVAMHGPTARGDRATDAVTISALSGEGADELVAAIGAALGVVAPHEVLLDAGDGRTRAWLYRSGAVLDEAMTEDGRTQLTLQADASLMQQLISHPEVTLRSHEA